MLKEIVTAFQSYFEAHRFIAKHGMWKWIFIPGLAYLLLFGGGIWLYFESSGRAVDALTEVTGLKGWIQRMDSSWLSFLLIFLGLMLKLIFMMFYFSLFKYIFLIVGSPLFAYLSEKTASIVEGTDFPFSFAQLMKDIWRGIRLALRNMLWQTVYTIAVLLLALIPVVGWITPLISFLVECYYYGFSMLDYSCERHKLSTSQSIAFIGRHKGLAIGNGMVFFLLHLIPFLGWLLAPSYAVIAATLSLYKLDKK